MTKILSRFSLTCHVLIFFPFLFRTLPAWYPQWNISLAFSLGALTGIGSLVLLLMDKHRKIPTERSTVLTITATLALCVVELGVIFWMLKGLGDFN
jgi:hypothetical protein